MNDLIQLPTLKLSFLVCYCSKIDSNICVLVANTVRKNRVFLQLEKNRNNLKYSLQWVATVVIMVIEKIGDAWNCVVIVKAENLLLQVWLVYNEDKYFFRGHEVCWWNLKLICVKQWWEDNAIVATCLLLNFCPSWANNQQWFRKTWSVQVNWLNWRRSISNIKLYDLLFDRNT